MAKAEKTEDFKYGVAELAKELGILDTSVRIALRKHEVKKNGTSYGWNSEKEFKSVVEQIRAPKKTELKAPAKKSAAKKSTKTKEKKAA